MSKSMVPWKFSLLALVSVVLVACATVPTGPLAEGEVRVSGLKVPEKVKAGFYDVTLEGVQKKGAVVLKDACFFWNLEGPYCFPVREVNGEVVARLQTRNPRVYTLSGYIRYIHRGETKKSNEVSAQLYVSP